MLDDCFLMLEGLLSCLNGLSLEMAEGEQIDCIELVLQVQDGLIEDREYFSREGLDCEGYDRDCIVSSGRTLCIDWLISYESTKDCRAEDYFMPYKLTSLEDPPPKGFKGGSQTKVKSYLLSSKEQKDYYFYVLVITGRIFLVWLFLSLKLQLQHRKENMLVLNQHRSDEENEGQNQKQKDLAFYKDCPIQLDVSQDSSQSQFGSQEEDMNIFSTQINHKQVIHPSKPISKVYQGTATTMNASYVGQGRGRMGQRPPKYMEKKLEKKMMYREKTQEDVIREDELTIVGKEIEINKECVKQSVQSLQTTQKVEQNKVQTAQNIEKERKNESILVSNFIEEPAEEQIEIIDLIQKTSLSPKKKQTKKSKKTKILISSKPKQQVPTIPQRRQDEQRSQGFSINRTFDCIPLQYYEDTPFCTVQIQLAFKGPIQALKIKSMIVIPYDSDELKIQRLGGRLQCGQKYEDFVEIISNVVIFRRQYSSETKILTLNLCKLRLPLNSKPQKNTFYGQTLPNAPLSINRVNILCNCGKKFQSSLLESGVTCPKCSLPSQWTLRSVTLK